MRSIRFVCAPLVIAGALLFVGGSAVLADDDCQKRTVHADHKLHEAIEKHGWQSQQAEHWRAELNSVRSYCWDHSHRWWDEDARQWRSEHWDDHDHDHDRDHDHH